MYDTLNLWLALFKVNLLFQAIPAELLPSANYHFSSSNNVDQLSLHVFWTKWSCLTKAIYVKIYSVWKSSEKGLSLQ